MLEEPLKDKEGISGLPKFEAPSWFSFAPVRFPLHLIPSYVTPLNSPLPLLRFLKLQTPLPSMMNTQSLLFPSCSPKSHLSHL
jgi:hypothetical protein